MESHAHANSRIQRMERECSASAGQARLLGWSLAILVAVLGMGAIMG